MKKGLTVIKGERICRTTLCRQLVCAGVRDGEGGWVAKGTPDGVGRKT